MLDLLLVNAPGKQRVYQALAGDLAAFEPPIWAGLIAAYVATNGWSVRILDAEAELLTYEQTVDAIVDANAALTVFTVYGQQPSASTQCMPAAGDVARMLHDRAPHLPTMFLGTHPSALARKTLAEEAVRFVAQGEGPLTIHATLEALRRGGDFTRVPGLWHRQDGKIVGNPQAPNQPDLDQAFPAMPWHLLPMDRYKAHNWHCWDHIDQRKPYASLYTSLGCPYKCSFCCINSPFGGAGIRYFSVDWVLRELEVLQREYGIQNVKIADEMFVLSSKHVMGISEGIIERGLDLNIWAYARVDTVKDRYLEAMKKAGFHWLALGVESGSKFVRDGVEKGRFGDEQIRAVVSKIRAHGINVIANYIFGLPDDTHLTMQETLDLAMSLNTEFANFYSAMAYPGSPLHAQAVDKKLPLPEDDGGPGWIGYSQHAFETYNLPTDTVPAGEVLSFRDEAFNRYFENPAYLAMIEARFGPEVREHLGFMTGHRLSRKYALPIGNYK